MDTNMQKFNILTEELLKEPIRIKGISSDKAMITYQTEGNDNTCLGFGLFKDKQMATQRLFISADAVVAEHTHIVIEWFICYVGEVVVSIFDGDGNLELEKILTPGEGMYVNAHQIHKVKAVTDSWLVVVSVPADEHFPEAKGE